MITLERAAAASGSLRFRKAGSVTASLNAELDLYSYAMHIDRSGLL